MNKIGQLHSFMKDANSNIITPFMHSLKQALHQKIAENEALFDFVQGAAPQGLCYEVLHPAGQWCSAKLLHTLGYESTQLESTTSLIAKHLPQEDWQHWQKQLQVFSSITPASTYQQKLHFVHLQGHQLWLLCETMCTYDAQGQLQGYLHVFADASQEHSNQEVLYKTQELLEQAGQMAQIGVFEVDMLHDIHHWSAVVREIHEVADDFQADMSTALAFYKEGDSRARIQQAVKRAIEEGLPFDEELQIITAKGNTRWVRAMGKSEIKEGVCIRIYGTFQDITVQKENFEKLRISEEIFRNNFEYAAIGMALLSPKGRWIRVNPSLCQMLGYSAEELLQKNFQEISHPADLEEDLQYLQKLTKGESAFYQMEKRYLHKQGHEVHVLLAVSALKDSQGNILNLLSQVMDISALKEAQELLRTKALLEETSQMARVGGFSKDLRLGTDDWSAVTREIHEVPEDFIPDMQQGLAFYKEGESREKIIRLVQKALQTGEGFDDEFQIITAKGHERWVRVIVNTEFEAGQCVRLYGTFQDIDQRKRAEEALKESEQRFRNLFDTIATVAVQGYDAEGKILYWNKASEHFYGYTAEEAVGRSLLDLIIPEEGHAIVRQDMAEMFATGKPIPAGELLLKKKDGTAIAVFSSHAYVEIPGCDAEMYCLDVDITPLKEVSEALRIQKERFDLMIHATKEGIFDWDIAAKKIYRSPAWKAMLGYQEEELPDNLEVFEQLLYAEDRQRVIQAMDKLLLKDSPTEQAVEARMHHKDGSLRWVAIKAVVIRNEVGQALRMVGAHTDITKQKQAEEALRESEKLLLETGRAAMVGGWHIDFDKKEVFWSDITKEIHELSPEYVAPTDYEQLLQERIAFYKDGYSRERIIEVIHRAKNEALGFDEELQLITGKGRERWVRVIGTPEMQNGRCTRIYGAFYDIDRQKRAEEKQKLLLHFTKLQNERLQNFAYIVSHNLRSHSANIQSLLDLLFDTEPALKEVELMQLLENSSEKLLETIEHLAQVAALDIDQQALEVVSLGDIVEGAISNVAALAKKSGVEIQNLLREETLVLGIPAYLDSVVLNFLTNALKYRSSERESYVRLHREVEADYWILCIEDNGLGIDLERNGKKLFGMYKTFHQHPEAKGVGLFITKNQIEAMGGKIEVTSHLGQGTRFKIYFQKAH